ncbi:hypothetical protein MKW98_019840 [Papaver atlanticum]|uniref:ARM repeat superfamily protein n=1 Tax=Papaver atlanticum TaxID=357466 RepID=A0AAD4S0K6_9MAGN|nr:hypothetical protein MKW98_019840 [Papaver atlanticum]
MEVESVNELSPKAARQKSESHLPGLDPEAVKLLITSVCPALEDSGGLLQKKADEFLSEKILMTYFSYCLMCCLRVTSQQNNASEKRRSDIISSFLTAIILAVKESNKKIRNMAYDLLVQIGHACGAEDQGGNKENLQQLFNMVAVDLAGETPQSIGAAVEGLARLAHEFSDLVSSTCNVLPSSFSLLQRKNREIIKVGSLSVAPGYHLCLLKVLVARSPAEWLQTHLRSVVEGQLRWQDDSKKNFKAKVCIQVDLFLFVLSFLFLLNPLRVNFVS